MLKGFKNLLYSIPGPLTEVSLPIDTLTKKLKGFAFVTYMIPEHAVKAFSELDGIIFQVGVSLTLCMLGNFSCFCCRLLTFFRNFTFSMNSFRNTISVSNGLDPHQD